MVYSKFFTTEKPKDNSMEQYNQELSSVVDSRCECSQDHIDLSSIMISPYAIEEPDTVQLDNIIVYREVLTKFPGADIKLLKIGRALSTFETKNMLAHVKYGVTDISNINKMRLSSLNAAWQTDDVVVATVDNNTLNIKYMPGV